MSKEVRKNSQIFQDSNNTYFPEDETQISSVVKELFKKNQLLFAPGKASNAGGVAVSGLEMAQNSLRYSWTREEVDHRLQTIMVDIHESCLEYGKDKHGYVDYVKGANIAGFVKVADAMLAQGVV